MRLASILAGFSLAMLAAAVGCGGDLAPGEYAAYRIASSEPTLSDDCFVDDPTSEHKSNFRSGSTVLVYNAPEADEDEFYLDAGGIVLPGELNDDGTYEFTGQETDIQDVGGQQIYDSDHDGIEDISDPLVDSDNDGLDDQSMIDDPDVDVDMDGQDDRLQDMLDQDNDGLDDRITYLASDTKITEKNTYSVELLPDGDRATGTFVVTTTRTCDGSQCAGYDDFKCKSTTKFVGVAMDPESVSVPVDSDDAVPNP
ncbi:MAG: hypothetical protein JNL21_04820 [Myxococcales bacterium]|nr:hypothetical protein [Myxococcales bacterium]